MGGTGELILKGGIPFQEHPFPGYTELEKGIIDLPHLAQSENKVMLKTSGAPGNPKVIDEYGGSLANVHKALRKGIPPEVKGRFLTTILKQGDKPRIFFDREKEVLRVTRHGWFLRALGWLYGYRHASITVRDEHFKVLQEELQGVDRFEHLNGLKLNAFKRELRRINVADIPNETARRILRRLVVVERPQRKIGVVRSAKKAA